MPILSGCCFCFDLKVGSKIIGILNLIGAIVYSLIFALLLVMVVIGGEAHKAIREELEKDTEPTFADDDYLDLTQEEKSFLEQILHAFGELTIDTLKIVLYILLAVSVLLIITSSMLIHGVRRNRRGLLIPFMVQEVVGLLLYAVFGIGMLVAFGTHMIIVSSAISFLVGFLITLYFLLVIISQYQALGLIRMHEEISMK